MSVDTKPSIIKAFFFSLLALVVFYLLSQIIGIVLVLIFSLISVIPVIGDLLALLFVARGDSPGSAILFCYLTMSYFFSISMLDHIVKSVPTRKLTIKLLGIYLIVLNAIFFLLNFLGDGTAWVNIGFIIAGIAFIVKTGKYVTVPAPSHNSPASNTKQEETVYYMEAANGMTIRVPESRLEAWQAEQDRIRNNPEATKLTDPEKRLVDAIVADIYGPKED